MNQYKQLTAEDRRIISKLNGTQMSSRSIAKIIGVSHSTISRELCRNRLRQGGYHFENAQRLANQRRCNANRLSSKLKRVHFEYIIRRLRATLSPEQISSEFQARFHFSISTKAIYEFVYRHDREKPDGPLLQKHLRVRSKMRRTKWRLYRGPIGIRPMISDRSEEIDQRHTYGHWEMDLFVGPQHSRTSALVLLERKSRFSIVKKLSSGTQKEVHRALGEALKQFSVKSITTDNGTEFLDHKTLACLAKAPIFYCNPYRAWEKGAVENVIGLYREFFPKAKSLPQSQEPFQKAQHLINSRPKKVLGFQSPISLIDKITKS